MSDRSDDIKLVPQTIYDALAHRVVELQAREQLLFEKSRSAWVIVDGKSGALVDANPRARELLGGSNRASEEFWTLFDPKNADRVRTAVLSTGAVAPRFLDQLTMLLPGGRTMLVELRLSARPDQGRITWLVEIDSEDFGSQPGLPTRPERLMEVVSNVSDRILHDLRNYLMPLTTHVELAMASVDQTSDAYRSLLEVRAACGTCQTSLSNLADIVRPKNPGERVAHARDVLDRAATILRYLLQRRVAIQVDVRDGTPPIRVPAYVLQRFLVGLAGRGAERRSGARVVKFYAQPTHDERRASISIDIEGLSPADESARESETAEAQNQIRALPQEAAATIRTESGPIWLRYALELDAFSTNSAPQAALNLTGSEDIVVVHDDALTRDILKNYFAAKGYHVLAGGNPREVLSTLAGGHPGTLVVLDLQPSAGDPLDYLDGFMNSPGVRRILVCGQGDIENRIPATARLRFLRKPYRVVELATLVRNMLDEEKK